MDMILIHQIEELPDEGQHPGLVLVQPGLLGQRGLELRQVEAVVMVGVEALEETLPLVLRRPAPAGHARFLRARSSVRQQSAVRSKPVVRVIHMVVLRQN